MACQISSGTWSHQVIVPCPWNTSAVTWWVMDLSMQFALLPASAWALWALQPSSPYCIWVSAPSMASAAWCGFLNRRAISASNSTVNDLRGKIRLNRGMDGQITFRTFWLHVTQKLAVFLWCEELLFLGSIGACFDFSPIIGVEWVLMVKVAHTCLLGLLLLWNCVMRVNEGPDIFEIDVIDRLISPLLRHVEEFFLLCPQWEA